MHEARESGRRQETRLFKPTSATHSVSVNQRVNSCSRCIRAQPATRHSSSGAAAAINQRNALSTGEQCAADPVAALVTLASVARSQAVVQSARQRHTCCVRGPASSSSSAAIDGAPADVLLTHQLLSSCSRFGRLSPSASTDAHSRSPCFMQSMIGMSSEWCQSLHALAAAASPQQI